MFPKQDTDPGGIEPPAVFQREHSLPNFKSDLKLPSNNQTDQNDEPLTQRRSLSFVQEHNLSLKKQGDSDLHVIELTATKLSSEKLLDTASVKPSSSRKMEAWTMTGSTSNSEDSRFRFPVTVKRETSSIDLSDCDSENSEETNTGSTNDILQENDSLFGERTLPGRTSRLAYTRTGPVKSHYVDLPDGTKVMAVDYVTQDLFPVGAEDKIYTEESSPDRVSWVERQYINETAEFEVVGTSLLKSSSLQMSIINTIFEANRPPEHSDISDLEEDESDRLTEKLSDKHKNPDMISNSPRNNPLEGESTSKVKSSSITRTNSFLKSRRRTPKNTDLFTADEPVSLKTDTEHISQSTENATAEAFSQGWQRKSGKVVPQSPKLQDLSPGLDRDNVVGSFKQRLLQGRHSPVRSSQNNVSLDNESTSGERPNSSQSKTSSKNFKNSWLIQATVHSDSNTITRNRPSYFKVKTEASRDISPIPEKDTPREINNSPRTRSPPPRLSGTPAAESGYSSTGSRAQTPEDSPARFSQSTDNVPVPGSIAPTPGDYEEGEKEIVRKARTLKRIETVCVHDLPDDDTDRPFRNRSAQDAKNQPNNFSRTSSSWRSSFFHSKRSKVKEINKNDSLKRNSKLSRGAPGCNNFMSLFTSCAKSSDDSSSLQNKNPGNSSKNGESSNITPIIE